MLSNKWVQYAVLAATALVLYSSVVKPHVIPLIKK
jgi:hypothetical protein